MVYLIHQLDDFTLCASWFSDKILAHRSPRISLSHRTISSSEVLGFRSLWEAHGIQMAVCIQLVVLYPCFLCLSHHHRRWNRSNPFYLSEAHHPLLRIQSQNLSFLPLWETLAWSGSLLCFLAALWTSASNSGYSIISWPHWDASALIVAPIESVGLMLVHHLHLLLLLSTSSSISITVTFLSISTAALFPIFFLWHSLSPWWVYLPRLSFSLRSIVLGSSELSLCCVASCLSWPHPLSPSSASSRTHDSSSLLPSAFVVPWLLSSSWIPVSGHWASSKRPDTHLQPSYRL